MHSKNIILLFHTHTAFNIALLQIALKYMYNRKYSRNCAVRSTRTTHIPIIQEFHVMSIASLPIIIIITIPSSIFFCQGIFC